MARPPLSIYANLRHAYSPAVPALGGAVVGMRLAELRQGFGMLPAPAAVLLGDRLGVVAGAEVEGVGQVAVRLGEAGP